MGRQRLRRGLLQPQNGTDEAARGTNLALSALADVDAVHEQPTRRGKLTAVLRHLENALCHRDIS